MIQSMIAHIDEIIARLQKGDKTAVAPALAYVGGVLGSPFAIGFILGAIFF